MSYCILCGENITEGNICESHKFKKMCVNCKDCVHNEETDEYICKNEENLEDAKQKMLNAAKEAVSAYSVDNITIQPIPLKKPIAKCKRWTLSEEVLNKITESFE